MELNTVLNQKESKWKQFLNLPKEEAKKCRFVCIDNNLRLFGCKTHNLKHGLRLHPPHKFEIKNEIVYIKDIDNKLKVWYSKVYAKKKNSRGGNTGGANTK